MTVIDNATDWARPTEQVRWARRKPLIGKARSAPTTPHRHWRPAIAWEAAAMPTAKQNVGVNRFDGLFLRMN